ncbi:MAG: hypothetical protein HWN80_16565 [Candidatus Lokiarchaeota archaeon]|nr:hypothetical protein [Candidatus Lokiarchaeota archaeon]
MEDVKINVKFKLSALWIALMFFYIYADILGFYAPGHIAALMTGEIGGIQITQEFLLLSAILMVIPSLMVFLSLSLPAKANRVANIIIGIVLALVLGMTFFVGEISAYYLLFGILEGVDLVLIVWKAWNWPK